MARQFNDKYLQSLKPKPKQYRVWESRGLGMRVLPSGTKSFVYRFTVDGKKQEMSLGIYPEVSLLTAHELHQADVVK